MATELLRMLYLLWKIELDSETKICEWEYVTKSENIRIEEQVFVCLFACLFQTKPLFHMNLLANSDYFTRRPGGMCRGGGMTCYGCPRESWVQKHNCLCLLMPRSLQNPSQIETIHSKIENILFWLHPRTRSNKNYKCKSTRKCDTQSFIAMREIKLSPPSLTPNI